MSTASTSAPSVVLIEHNLELNHLPSDRHRFIAGDAIDYIIQEPLDYDIVILDPPAFAKKKTRSPEGFSCISKAKPKSLRKNEKPFSTSNLLLLIASR